MRLTSLFLALGFGIAAYLQLNDDDPIGWVVLYASAAGVCTLGFMRRVVMIPAGVVLLFATLGLVIVGPDVQFGAVMFDTEEGREFLGLSIIATWMVALLVHHWTLYGFPFMPEEPEEDGEAEETEGESEDRVSSQP